MLQVRKKSRLPLLVEVALSGSFIWNKKLTRSGGVVCPVGFLALACRGVIGAFKPCGCNSALPSSVATLLAVIVRVDVVLSMHGLLAVGGDDPVVVAASLRLSW